MGDRIQSSVHASNVPYQNQKPYTSLTPNRTVSTTENAWRSTTPIHYSATPNYDLDLSQARNSAEIHHQNVIVPVKEIEVPVYVEKKVEYIKEVPKEIVNYIEKEIEIIKEVEEIVEKKIVKVVEVPVPVVRIIEREVYVDVYHDKEVDIEQIHEHDEITTKVNTVVEEVEVPLHKEVIVEEPEIIEKVRRMDVTVFKDVPVVQDIQIIGENHQSTIRTGSRMVGQGESGVIYHGSKIGQRITGAAREVDRSEVSFPAAVINGPIYNWIRNQYQGRQEPVEEFKKIFTQVDRNHDGQLSRDEVRRFFKVNGNAKDENADIFFDACDVDGNGFIDLQEWNRALNVLQTQQKLDQI